LRPLGLKKSLIRLRGGSSLSSNLGQTVVNMVSCKVERCVVLNVFNTSLEKGLLRYREGTWNRIHSLLRSKKGKKKKNWHSQRKGLNGPA